MRQVSFIIPSYQSEETLPGCLEAVFSLEADVSYEVIVVDSSGTKSRETLQSQFPNLQWISSPQRLLPGAARNLGLRYVQTPWVVFLDSDVVLDRDWLSKAWPNFSPSCAALLGPLRPFAERNLAGACLFFIQFSKYFPGTPQHQTGVAASYALMVRAADARAAGGFPEDDPVLEDYGFCLRLLKNSGKPILFHPFPGASHINKRTWGVFRSQLQTHGYWAARVRKRRDFPGHFLVKNPLLVFALLPYRMAVTGFRSLRWGWGPFLRYLLFSPALAYGLWIWTWSFYKSARHEPA